MHSDPTSQTSTAPVDDDGVPPFESAGPALDTVVPVARVDWVANRLRDVILRGVLVSGEKIYPVKLAQEWNISPTPLREAIQRLASEGLVDVTPQRGARVAALSPQQAKELYELRILLEPVALRDSLSHFREQDRVRVAETYALYEQAWVGRTEITYAMYESHKDFHDATLSRCTSQQLVQLVSSLTVHCMRYTKWLERRDRIAEHRRIADAVAADDVEAATASIIQHSKPGLEWAQEQLAATGLPPESILGGDSLSAVTDAIERISTERKGL